MENLYRSCRMHNKWRCLPSHANQARIRTWPRDPETAMWANDTVEFVSARVSSANCQQLRLRSQPKIPSDQRDDMQAALDRVASSLWLRRRSRRASTRRTPTRWPSRSPTRSAPSTSQVCPSPCGSCVLLRLLLLLLLLHILLLILLLLPAPLPPPLPAAPPPPPPPASSPSPHANAHHAGARLAEARAYNMLKEITDDPTFATTYLDYAQGYNLTNRSVERKHFIPSVDSRRRIADRPRSLVSRAEEQTKHLPILDGA